MTPKPYVFVLRYMSSRDGGRPLGVYSTLEFAQTEGQRYHKAKLDWALCISDDKRCKIWHARLPEWFTPDTYIEVTRFRLDSRKFR